MKAVWLIVPGALATRTGGSIYDRRIAEGLRARGWEVAAIELDPIVDPLAPPLIDARAQVAMIPDGSLVLVDGLVFGTIPELIEQESSRLQFVPIVHMVLSTTPGVTQAESVRLDALERRALSHATHIVVTGTPTRDLVRSMSPEHGGDRITRVPPGIDRVSLKEEPHAEGTPLRLLCVANVTWGKGYDILLQALAALPVRDWTITCAGSLERDADYSRHVRTMATELGLDSCVRWIGEAGDSLDREFRYADLFVLPTRGETYGMAVAEAIAHGVPVVSTRTGEIPSIVGEGGSLVEPGDENAFAAHLHVAVSDREVRHRLRAGARAAASRLPTWDAAADAMSGVLRALIDQPSAPNLAGPVPTPPKPEDRGTAPPKPDGQQSLSEWLALRQTADFAARSTTLTSLLVEHLAGVVRPLRILDLGTGTGSNVRYLAPRLGGEQHWLVVDKDRRLLAEAAERSRAVAPNVHVDTQTTDLGAFDVPEIFDGRHLVTASALLDLVSEHWLQHVAAECRRVRACALFTITYNGRNECDPHDRDDGAIFELFNRHQLTDKGLGGPAAGPQATAIARRIFLDHGFDVRVGPSDWQIGPDQRKFQRQLIEGWALAAAEIAPNQRQMVEEWKQRRLDHVEAGSSRITVGHHDLLALHTSRDSES